MTTKSFLFGALLALGFFVNLHAYAAHLPDTDRTESATQGWLCTASTEIQAKEYDLAVTHLKRAIELVTKRQFGSFGNNGLLDGSAWVIRSLAEAGRSSDAEALYLQILDRCKSLYGSDSLEYDCDLSHLFGLYAIEKDDAKALQYLDQILTQDPRKLELGRYHSTTGRANVLAVTQDLYARRNQKDLALAVLKKLLASQRNIYGEDDIHVAAVLAQIGSLEIASDELDRAEKDLRAALAIEALYGNEMGTGTNSDARSQLLSLLEKQHNKKEITRLHNALQVEKKRKEEHWSLPQAAGERQTRAFYGWWHKEAPYNYRCLSAGINLLELAVQKKDWQRVADIGPECINILAHNSLFQSGGCTPSPSPATRKFQCYKSVIEANINLGNNTEAHKWLDKAVSDRSYEASTEELIFLSEIENQCGNRNEALAYCKQAEQSLPTGSAYNFHRGAVYDQFKKIGAEADLKRINDKARIDMLINNEAELRKIEADKQNKKTPSEPGWSAEPREPKVFDPPEEIDEAYSFKYAALASDSLWLKDEARVMRSDAHAYIPTFSFAGSFGNVTCFQPHHKSASLQFLYDGFPGSLIPKCDLPPMRSGGGMPQTGQPMEFNSPPPVMALPFKQALAAPHDAKAILTKEDRLILNRGDYLADQITTNSIILPDAGETRIFLKKTYTGSEPIFRTTANAFINSSDGSRAHVNMCRLEIWYDGCGKIVLDDNTHFNGIIYAPNAKIQLGDGVRFLGAMVAKDIVAGRDTRIMFDTGLFHWKANERGHTL